MIPRVVTAQKVRTCGACGASHASPRPPCPLCGHDPRVAVVGAVLARDLRHGPLVLAVTTEVLAALDAMGDPDAV